MSTDPNFEEQFARNMPPKTDAAAAVDFLRKFHPSERWLVTAIKDNKTSPISAFFDASSADKALAWIEAKNAHLHIYFSPNPLRPEFKGIKASEEDVAGGAWLHADIDPPKECRDLKAWREAIIKQWLPALKLPPRPS